MNLADITGGEVIALLTALFTFLNLIFSGRAFQVSRNIRKGLERLIRNVGHPVPDRTGVSDGRTLTEKVESLTDAFKAHIEADLVRRASSETPGSGRRRADG